ncbi:MAG: hypothetical protein LBR08_09320 [Bacteroidales bacterium]|jgi:hypothetical protein|nr:hypothetical protein [Bacteroidales bacterium]
MKMNIPSFDGARLPVMLCALCCVAAACAGVSGSELTRAKTIANSREQFAALPFGFVPTVENLERHYGKTLRMQRYVINNRQGIAYRYSKGNTELVFLQSGKGEIEALSGSIYTSRIKLKNDIAVGLSRKEFFWKFSDWLYDSSDVLFIHSPATGCSFKFVFSNDKLKSIHVINNVRQFEKMRRNIISGNGNQGMKNE